MRGYRAPPDRQTLRGYIEGLREAQIRERQHDRNGPIKLKWQDRDQLVTELLIDDVLWAYVEWSEKRQEWCIEDSQGRCLRHAADLRATADSKQGAIELAEQMIRDGRLPTPAEALERRDAERQAVHDKPANVRARQKAKEKRDHSAELSMRSWRAKFRDDEETPLWECIADAFDFSDPNLWRSNSFASLRPRLVVWMQAIVAELEYDLDCTAKRHHPWRGKPEPAAAPKQRVAAMAPKLARAREILALLEGEPHVRSEAAE